MKNIKLFKFWYSYEFEKCLKDYGYTLEDVKGFGVSSVERFRGNILKTYIIYVNDGASVYFSVVYFKSFNEHNKARLGFKGDKLKEWYEGALIKFYKLNNEYIMD